MATNTFETHTWIKLLRDCRWGKKGEVVQLGPDQAFQAVDHGRGVVVEDPTAPKPARKTSNKAMSAKG
jgi:hypothetical protein